MTTDKITLLDHVPDHDWFFCVPLSTGVLIITVLGIIHPLFWVKVIHAYRSGLFLFIYVIISFWTILSCALLYAIYTETSCLYKFWIWYTMVFAVMMVAMMLILIMGFWTLDQRGKAGLAAVGFIYYLVTLYFVVVVNRQRKELFGPLQANCGDCGSIASSVASEQPVTNPPKDVTKLAQPVTEQPTTTMTAPTPVPTPAPTTAPTPAPTTTTTTVGSKTPRLRTPSMEALLDAVYTSRLVPLSPKSSSDDGIHEELRELLKNSRETYGDFSIFGNKPSICIQKVAFGEMELVQKTTDGHPKTGGDKHEHTTRAWVVDLVRRDEGSGMHRDGPAEPPTLRSVELDRVARLAELLINSDECRTPHKPAHGQYTVRRRRSTLRLKLRCDPGYRESSGATKCKHNWWDRPMPQCRKRHPPGPLPDPGGGCIMPVYPKNGVYTVADHAGARPGDTVSGDNVILTVTCDVPYRAVDPYVVCVGGRWRHGPPSCLEHCKLAFDPAVDYKCLKAYKDKFLSCEAWQPDGATVVAACRAGHAHRGPFRYMRCRGHIWDHVVSCAPNANFTR